MQEFQLAATAFGGGVSADKLADPRAVNVIHISEIEHDACAFVVQQSPDRLAKQGAAFTQGYPPTEIHDRGLTSISMRCAQCHDFFYAPCCGEAPVPPCPFPPGFSCSGSFLAMTISAPPVRPETTSNSSINARIKKMPRP